MDKPIHVGYMTAEDIENFPQWAGLVTEDLEGSIEAIRVHPKLPIERKGQVLAHELGHVRYPTKANIGVWDYFGRDAKRSAYGRLEYIFGELGANYYELKLHPYSTAAKENIKYWKGEAFALGLSRGQINRLDRLAKRRVDYTGRSVRKGWNLGVIR